MTVMTRTRRWSVALAAALVGSALVTSPAMAGGKGEAGTDEGSVNAKATITVTGDVASGSGGSVTVSAPAICWWEPVELSTDGVASIAALFAFFGLPFDAAAIDKIVEDEESGVELSWYGREIREGATEAQIDAAGCNDFSGPYQGLLIGYIIRPFEPGNPPEPLPDPEEMADVAFKSIDLAEPELNWNPKAQALGGGTLVNLPTWFWVTNPEAAIGGGDAERSVTATAAAGESQVSVTVTAKAGSMQIASPGGAASCSTEQALTAYASGVSDSSACTVTFERSSGAYDGGFPVRATVGWTASWTGTGPGVPAGEQALDGIVLSSTSNVPVRESQATVTATD